MISTRFEAPVAARVLRQCRPRSIGSWLSAPQRAVLMEERSEDRHGLFARAVAAIIETGAWIDRVVGRTRGAAVENVFAQSGPGAVATTASSVTTRLPRGDPMTTVVADADTL